MRLAPSSHKEWVPRDYQTRAVGFLMTQPNGALFLDPGLGKTSIALAAFCELQQRKMARSMLVIAPKRVCYLVWRQEAEQWSQFRHLKFALLHGRKKDEALQEDADVYLINPEGVEWLINQLSPAQWRAKFDTLVIDELTKFKNARSKRFKYLHGGKAGKVSYPNLAALCSRRWGLTGTPAPNGLEDLFGQMLLLDDGQTLGKYFTHFKDRYFVPDFNGFGLRPQRNADERIRERLKYSTLRMSAEDYLELPPLIEDVRHLEMDDKTKKIYREFKKEMVAELPGGVITADTAGGVHAKLKQLAGGAVYTKPATECTGPRPWEKVHDIKLDALDELIDELAGEQLIIAYEFNHELERLKERYGNKLAVLGKGTTDTQMVEIERDWNAGKIQLLATHPASSGHGLNLQKSGAGHICWFNPTWDFELYDQLIRRIFRQGTSASRIVNHSLALEGTVDYMALRALEDKDTTQERLLQGIGQLLDIETEIPATGSRVETTMETDEMVRKLPTSGGGGLPPGWGGDAQPAAQPAQAQPEQPPQQAAQPPAAPPVNPPATQAPAELPPGWGAQGQQAQPAPAPQQAPPAAPPAPPTVPPAPPQQPPSEDQSVDREQMEAKLTQPGGSGQPQERVSDETSVGSATQLHNGAHVTAELDIAVKQGNAVHFKVSGAYSDVRAVVDQLVNN